MNIDTGIANNIVKLASAWDKASEISTKIESQLVDYKVDFGNTQLKVVDRFPVIKEDGSGIDRKAVLSYLQSTVQAIEHDKGIILGIQQAFYTQNPYLNEFGVAGVAQLLNSLVNLDKELVKMSKIVSDLLLNWEQIDSLEEGGPGVSERDLIRANSNSGFSSMKFDED